MCISILHPPGEDAFNPQESASERWSPVHTVRERLRPSNSAGPRIKHFACMPSAHALFWLQVESIVLSVISMLSSPNDESPANVDAARDWRSDRAEFKKKVARVVRRSQEML